MRIFLRKVHKWVGLAIGIQVFLWLLSGVMMAQLDPDKVSGDKWAGTKNVAPPPISVQALLEPGQLPTAQLEGAFGIQLEMNRRLPVYRIQRADGEILLSAVDGSVITFDRHFAEQVAGADFTGKGVIDSVNAGQAPDIATRDSTGPYWRVDFSDKASTSIYISASSGEILERRNTYWRIRDFFWMLHIMDYTGRENFNNSVILTIILCAIWLAISGFTLLFYSFRKRDFAFLGRQR